MSKLGWLWICWLWIWLFGSASLWAADYPDPFLPPEVASCAVRSASLPGWLLKGVIGTAERRYGWVMTPQKQWLPLQPQQLLPDGNWQVVQILPQQLALAQDKPDNACLPRTDPLVLILGQTETQNQ